MAQAPFSTLTPRGQARRLRRMAIDALSHYDVVPTQVRLASNHLNGVFRVDTPVGDRYALRISVPGDRSRPEIESEKTWFLALDRETDAAPNLPVRNHDGEFVTTAATEGVPEPRHSVLFTWVPSPLLASRLTPESVEQMGVLSATLHAHATSWSAPPEFTLPRFDRVFTGTDPIVLFDSVHDYAFTTARRGVFERMLATVERELKRLYSDSTTTHVIHGDLHHENVKVDRGTLRPIDFAEVTWGYAVQDIAMTFYDFRYFTNPATHAYDDLRVSFRRGYENRLPWLESYSGQIDLHQMAHRLMVANWVLLHADAARNPAFFERLEGEFRALLDHHHPTT